MRALSRLNLARLLALTFSATVTSAIRLSDFIPTQVGDLPEECQDVYTSEIAGCRASDFPPIAAMCSMQCVNGLFAKAMQVQDACGGVAGDIPDGSILGIFLLGLGPRSLCQGNDLPINGFPSGGIMTLPTTPYTKTALVTDSLEPSSTITVIVGTSSSTPPPPPPPKTKTTQSTSSKTKQPPPNTTSKASTTRTKATATKSQSYRLKSTIVAKVTSSAVRIIDADDNRTGLGDSGGGSPFDFPVAAASKHGLLPVWATSLMALGLSIFIMFL